MTINEQVESGVPQPQPPSEQEVAKLAYQIWEENGCPDGTAESDWATAEERLTYQAKLVAAQPQES